MEAQFLTGGDRSLYVKLGDEISLEVNGRVKSLMQKLGSGSGGRDRGDGSHLCDFDDPLQTGKDSLQAACGRSEEET